NEFHAMVANDLPFPKSTTSMLRTVAARFDGVQYTEKLPPSWMTLYLLTRLPQLEFDRRLADGTINPPLAKSEVRGWIQSLKNQPVAGAGKNGAEGFTVQEQSVQLDDAAKPPSKTDPNPSEDEIEACSTETAHKTKGQVGSSPASAKVSGPDSAHRED